MHVDGMLNSVETVIKEIDRLIESICLSEPRPTSSRRTIEKPKRFLDDEERNLNSLEATEEILCREKFLKYFMQLNLSCYNVLIQTTSTHIKSLLTCCLPV